MKHFGLIYMKNWTRWASSQRSTMWQNRCRSVEPARCREERARWTQGQVGGVHGVDMQEGKQRGGRVRPGSSPHGAPQGQRREHVLLLGAGPDPQRARGGRGTHRQPLAARPAADGEGPLG